MNSISATASIEAAAQRWLARLLAQDCSDAERATFEQWRAADPAHAAAFRQVEEVWERSATMRDDPALTAALQEALRPAVRARSYGRAWWPSLAVAASVVLVVAMLFRSFGPEDVPTLRYATALGEQRTVVLDDGSTVILDTDTDLLVQLGKRERRLTLQRGQAEFQVDHDANRPFVVGMAGGSVTATGTLFQVRVGGGTGTVTLLEGRVIVAAQAGNSSAASKTLAPGERIAIGSPGALGPLQRVPKAELASAHGWTQGNLVVEEWPLESLLVEMNRYSATKLRLGDPGLGSVPVSGVFKAGDQQSFALSLEYGWPIRADRRTSGEIVLFRK